MNPANSDSISAAILEALTMTSEERQKRHNHTFTSATTFTASKWLRTMMKSLEESQTARILTGETLGALAPLSGLQLRDIVHESPKLHEAGSISKLVILDYEAVMVQPQSLFDLAVIPASTRAGLMQLCSIPGVFLLVMTTRPRDLSEKMLKEIPCWIAAEHGAVVRLGGSGSPWIPTCAAVTDSDTSWRDAISDIFDYYHRRSFGSFVESTPVSMSLHLEDVARQHAKSVAKMMLATLSEVIGKLPVLVQPFSGRSVDVIRIGVEKSAAIAKALERLEKYGPMSKIICVLSGHEATDNRAFSFLQKCCYSVDRPGGEARTPTGLSMAPTGTICTTNPKDTISTTDATYLVSRQGVSDFLGRFSVA